MSAAGEHAAHTVMELHGEPCRVIPLADPSSSYTTTCIPANEQGESIKGRVITSAVLITVLANTELNPGDVIEVLAPDNSVAMRVGISKPRDQRRYLSTYSGVQQPIS